MKKVVKLTQLRLADNFVKQMRLLLDDEDIEHERDPHHGLYTLHRRLAEVLDKAHNRPPVGQSDGSISAENRIKLREVERAARELMWAIDNYDRKIRNE